MTDDTDIRLLEEARDLIAFLANDHPKQRAASLIIDEINKKITFKMAKNKFDLERSAAKFEFEKKIKAIEAEMLKIYPEPPW